MTSLKQWYHYFEKGSAWFWERASQSCAVSSESLGLYRWLWGVSVLLFTPPYFAWIDDVPRALYDPPVLSPAALASGFPPSPFFSVLDGATIIVTCLVTVGLWTRWTTALWIALILLGSNFNYSFGKIDHGIMKCVLAACMVICGWGRHYSLDALLFRPRENAVDSKRVVRQGMSLLGVALAVGMITAGVPKSLAWIDFDLTQSGFLSWYFPNRYSLGRDKLLASYVPHLPVLLYELGDYFAVFLELMGIAALLISRRVWLLWLAVVTTFHLLNSLLLNIPFNGQVLTYVTFIDFAARSHGSSAVNRKLFSLGAIVVALLGLAHVVIRARGLGTGVLYAQDMSSSQAAALYASLPVCVVAIALLASESLRAGQRHTSAKVGASDLK